MNRMTTTTHDAPQAPALAARPIRAIRRVSADLAIGLTVLGVMIVGRLLWALTDGSLLSALGTR